MRESIRRRSSGVPKGVDHKPRVVPTGVPVSHEHIRDFTDHIGPKHKGHPYNERHDGELEVK